MTTKIIKISTLIIASVLGFSMLNILPVSADTADTTTSNSSSSAPSIKDIDACDKLPKDSIAYESAGCNNTSDKLPSVVQNILNAIILVSGLVAVIFIIIGGVQYMTSAGDAGKFKKARDTILYSVIGLVICVLAFAIVNWTIGVLKNA